MTYTFDSNKFQWKISVTASLIVHVLLGLLIFLYPADKKERTSLFNARLITPEELKSEYPSAPSIRSIPKTGAMPSHRQEPITRYVPPSAAKTGGLQEEVPVNPSIPVPSEPGAKGITTPPAGILPSVSSQNTAKAVPHSPSLKELIADAKEVAEKTAQKEEIKKDTGVTFDTHEFRYQAYMARLKEKIEHIWNYPPDAAARGIYGDLRIKFTIKKDGMLGAVELERTSGHRDLDEAAMQALKDAEPFWPLPDEWGKDAMTIDGHFVYSLYGTYIR